MCVEKMELSPSGHTGDPQRCRNGCDGVLRVYGQSDMRHLFGKFPHQLTPS